MEDRDIIELYTIRNEAAIVETQMKYGNYAYTIAFRILENQEDAKECINDGYLRLWNCIPPQQPRQLSAFLGRIVRNIALNRYNCAHAQKRNSGQVALALHELEECISISDTFNQDSSQEEITTVINIFLRKQNDENRIIFVKRYWYLKSIKEIAEEMFLSESKVKSSLYRSREKLKRQLKKAGIYV